jgi:hypothetical protein
MVPLGSDLSRFFHYTLFTWFHLSPRWRWLKRPISDCSLPRSLHPLSSTLMLTLVNIVSWDHVVVAPYGRSETSSVFFFFIHPSTSHLGRVDRHILYASLSFCCYSTLLPTASLLALLIHPFSPGLPHYTESAAACDISVIG